MAENLSAASHHYRSRSSLSLSLPSTPKAVPETLETASMHELREGQLSARLSQSSSPPKMRLSEAEVLTSLQERSFGTGLVGTRGHNSVKAEPRRFSQSTVASRLRSAFTGLFHSSYLFRRSRDHPLQSTAADKTWRICTLTDSIAVAD